DLDRGHLRHHQPDRPHRRRPGRRAHRWTGVAPADRGRRLWPWPAGDVPKALDPGVDRAAQVHCHRGHLDSSPDPERTEPAASQDMIRRDARIGIGLGALAAAAFLPLLLPSSAHTLEWSTVLAVAVLYGF